MEFSKYQKAIFEWVKTGNGNLVVEAVAGSSKTTVMVESTKLLPPKKTVCFLAYNKSIAEELKKRVPSHVNVSTFHALGWRAIKEANPAAVLDDNKVFNHIKEYFKENKIKYSDWGKKIKISNNIKKIIDLMRFNLMIDNIGFFQVEDLCEKFNIEVLDKEEEYSRYLIKRIVNDQSCYDFTDMIFVPIYRKMAFQQYDWVFVDEFQDASPIQQKIFLASLKPSGRFVCVGDKNQSIYRFMGASAESFDQIKSHPNTVSLPLSICYRCGKNIVKWAKQLVPQIEHFEEKADGQVITNGSIKNVQDGDTILCRVNFPLAILAGEFLKQGKRVHINGKDIGKNLLKLLDHVDSDDLVDSWEYLDKKLKKLEAKLLKQNDCVNPREQPEYFLLEDKIRTIKALADGCDTKSQVEAKINSIFSDSKNESGITLSTAHSYKGREAKNIFIVEPQLIPFPFYLHIPGEAETEKNLDYVARTRAIEKLEYVKDWSAYSKK